MLVGGGFSYVNELGWLFLLCLDVVVCCIVTFTRARDPFSSPTTLVFCPFMFCSFLFWSLAFFFFGKVISQPTVPLARFHNVCEIDDLWCWIRLRLLFLAFGVMSAVYFV